MGSVNNVNRFLNIEDSHLRVVSGNVYAQALNVGGITVGSAHGLQSITSVSNTTSNTVQFTNATTAFKVTSNIELTSTSKMVVDSNVVTEYTGPHDRPLRKYPEVALTQHDESATSGYVVTRSGGTAYLAFDEDTTSRWYSGSDSHYDSAGGAAITDPTNVNVAPRLDTNTDYGDWLAIEVPTGIKLESFKLMRYDGGFPSSGTLYAKNSSGDSWTEIYRYDGYTGPSTGAQQDWTHVFHVNSTIVYKNFALVGRVREAGQQGSPGISLKDWELYGHEEGSGSLDTTLKSVYNVPATTGTQLEVYYDGQDLAAMPSTVTDLAGGDQNGTPYNVTLDSTTKSFVFNGSSSYINGSLTNWTDNQTHTISLWVKFSSLASQVTLFGLWNTASTERNYSSIEYRGNDTSSTIAWYHYANDKRFTVNIVENQWYHISAVYTGSISTEIFYLNGTPLSDFTQTGTDDTILLGTSPSFSLGNDFSRNNYYFAGSIANFRLYSKALNADQVKELYDYQKDYFLGSKSQVTLYKGHLGVGVTEPSGQLLLAGDERIQEYPPGIMNINETLIPGHGIFKARSSTSSTINERNPWAAFNKSTTQGWDSLGSISDYSTIDGSYTSNEGNTLLSNGSNYSGEFLEIELPYPIKLKTNYFYPQQNTAYGTPRFFREALVLGSNNGHTWDILQSISETSYSYTYVSEEYLTVNTNSETYYTYFRVAVNKVIGGTNGNRININEWRLFGTPGPTTLDKGSLTLGRSLDVPRVSRYDVDTETPRPEKLVVDFDTTVNSSPTDISGWGNHGTFNGTNMNYSSADKAFVFNGTDDYIQATTNLGSGDRNVSVSVWLNLHTMSSAMTPFFIGVDTSGQGGLGVDFNINGSSLVWFTTNGSAISLSNWNTYVPLNTWTHLIFEHNTGGLKKLYINGISRGTFTSSTNLSLGSNPTLYIGNRISTNYFDGSLSNFKVYNVALEPSEVQKLYRLGRTGRSMVISDTAVGIGKVPEAQLDVRGVGKFDAVGIGDGVTNGPDTSMSAPLCVLTYPTLRGQSSWDLSRSIAKFGYQNGSNHYGISFSVNANSGHGLIQTYNQNGGGAQYELHLQPAGGVTKTNGSTVTSDDRVKVDETFIVNATETLMKLRPQTYTRYAMMVDETRPNLDSWRRYEAGLVTQEVYYDAPELRHIVNVSDDADLSGEDIRTSDDPVVDPDYRNWGSSVSSLDYIQLIPYLIKSNQEQEEEIRVLSAIKEAAFLQTSQITILQNVVFSLTKRIEALENA